MKTKTTPKTYRGAPISAGKGFGQAVIVEVYDYDYIPQKITPDAVPSEVERFKDAQKQAIKYYEDLCKSTKKTKISADNEDITIIEMYKCLANDPMLAKDVLYKIQTELCTAEYAVRIVADNAIANFQMIKDEYFKDRDKDISEVCERILYYLSRENRDNSEEKLFDKDVVLFINRSLILSDIVGKNIEKIKAIVCLSSGKSSHAAIVARSNSIPVISGVDLFKLDLLEGNNVLVDCDAGEFIINPSEDEIDKYHSYIDEINLQRKGLPEFLRYPIFTSDGMQIAVMANVSIEEDTKLAAGNGADEIGLVRTEILFIDHTEFPTEDEQISYYNGIFEKIGKDKKVNIRVMDVGGDKMSKFICVPKEENPFMGWRAVRIYREKTEYLEKQLNAILKAGKGKKYGIMFPMITTLSEWEFMRNLTVKTAEKLEIELPSLGVLFEVPLAILEIGAFLDTIDFASIGTNDLIQYLSAADRSNSKVNYLYNPAEPAFLKIVKNAIDQCNSRGKPISLCGDIAASPEFTILLLGLGLTRFSVSPPMIPIIKEIISSVPLMKIKEETNHMLLTAKSSKAVNDWLKHMNGKYCKQIFKRHHFFPQYSDSEI
jgi:phosphotransferase system enzyme I (PtsI)